RRRYGTRVRRAGSGSGPSTPPRRRLGRTTPPPASSAAPRPRPTSPARIPTGTPAAPGGRAARWSPTAAGKPPNRRSRSRSRPRSTSTLTTVAASAAASGFPSSHTRPSPPPQCRRSSPIRAPRWPAASIAPRTPPSWPSTLATALRRRTRCSPSISTSTSPLHPRSRDPPPTPPLVTSPIPVRAPFLLISPLHPGPFSRVGN
ncbi:transcription factor 4, partial [Musa troglodytarum]